MDERLYKQLTTIVSEGGNDELLVYIILYLKRWKKKKTISVPLSSIRKGLGFSLKRVRERVSFLEGKGLVKSTAKDVLFNGGNDISSELYEDVIVKESKKVGWRFKSEFQNKVSEIYERYGLLYASPKEDDKAVFWMYNRNTGQPTTTMQEKMAKIGVSSPLEFIDTIIGMAMNIEYRRKDQSFYTLSEIHYNWANIYNGYMQQTGGASKPGVTGASNLIKESEKRNGPDFWLSFIDKYDIYRTLYCIIYHDKKDKLGYSVFENVTLPEDINKFNQKYIDGLPDMERSMIERTKTLAEKAKELGSYSRL